MKKFKWRSGLVMAVVHLASVLDALAFFATLGLWNPSLRAEVLFADWVETFTKGEY